VEVKHRAREQTPSEAIPYNCKTAHLEHTKTAMKVALGYVIVLLALGKPN
jgi:hypothetical protein